MDSIAIPCGFANPGYGSIMSSCCVSTYLAVVMVPSPAALSCGE